jgi:multidrug efflux pump subunit AcrB
LKDTARFAEENTHPRNRKMEIPEGYNMRWMGEYELQSTALHNIFRYLPVVFMLVVLILILLFNDIKRPVIVLACIPLAIIGNIPGLLVSDGRLLFGHHWHHRIGRDVD